MIPNLYRKTIFIISFAVLFTACSKKSNSEKDNQQPVITLMNPVVNFPLTAGQPIEINGSITDNGTIAEVHIHVTNNTTGAKYLDVHLYPASSSSPFFNNDLIAASGITYKVEIIAIDRAANEGRIAVTVMCN